MFAARLALVAITLVAAGCLAGADEPAPKLADQIIGRWERNTTFTFKGGAPDAKVETFIRKEWVEFRKDGTFAVTQADIPELKDRLPSVAKGSKISGKYRFVAGGEIEVTVEADGQKDTDRVKVDVTKDELSLAQLVKGKAQPADKYRRAKD